jgi:citrate lyase beta subunit
MSFSVPLVVRINALPGDAGENDIDWLERLSPPAAVMLAKAESREVIANMHDRLNAIATVRIIERTAGLGAMNSRPSGWT